MKKIYATLFVLCLILGSAMPLCKAADYDFKELTPEIKKALSDRQIRYAQIQALKREGVIGENNKGYVSDLRKDATSATMVTAENRDRRVIYENLATQNKLGSTGLLEVQKAFAEVQRDKAGAGDMIQTPSGDWEKK